MLLLWTSGQLKGSDIKDLDTTMYNVGKHKKNNKVCIFGVLLYKRNATQALNIPLAMLGPPRPSSRLAEPEEEIRPLRSELLSS